MKQINITLMKVLSACLLLSLAVQCCAATTVSLADTGITTDPGDVVVVPLIILGMTDFGTGTINITYDPSVVHVTGVSGSSDSVVAAFNTNNVAGFTAISASNAAGASGDFVFADVEFTAVGAGSTPLNIDVISLYDKPLNAISATIDNGLFTSGGVSTSTVHETLSSGESTTGLGSVTPTPSSTPTPTKTPSARAGANPTSASESAPHRDEGGSEGADASITSPTVESPNSEETPGFGSISVVIGLMILSMIIGRDDT